MKSTGVRAISTSAVDEANDIIGIDVGTQAHEMGGSRHDWPDHRVERLCTQLPREKVVRRTNNMLSRSVVTLGLLVSLVSCAAHGSDDGDALYNTLSGAVSRNDLPGVIRFLEEGADPTGPDENGYAPLVTAAQTASPAVVAALLAAGADPDSLPADIAFTPLMVAAMRDDSEGTEIVAALLAASANPCVVVPHVPEPSRTGNRFEGMTPLEVATSVGNDASVTAIARAANC